MEKYARQSRLWEAASLGVEWSLPLRLVIASSTRPAASRADGESDAHTATGSPTRPANKNLVNHFLIVY
jgi:hypothetical protein